MIKIEISDRNTIEKWYFESINARKRRGIGGDSNAQEIFRYFESNMSRIVLCKAIELESVITEFETQIKKTPKGIDAFKNYMEGQYDDFIGKYGYELATKLNVKVCPYCNRQYTSTIKKKGEKITRPQFDHFYPKSRYPYLALSLYNLVPCCPNCNHSKGEDAISINPHINGFGDDCRFEIDTIEECVFGNNNRNSWGIKLPDSGEHSNHIEIFALNDLYNEHKDYVEEIVFKAQAYSDNYCEDIKKFTRSLSDYVLTEKEIKLLIFGNYTHISEYSKRPLSKLTADILHQLEILK